MKLLVYTAIMGHKDTLADIQHPHGADYLCFTDDPSSCRASGWKVAPLDNPYGEDKDGWCRAAKRPKVLPHLYMPQGYDWSIWIDGARSPSADLRPLVERTKLFGLFEHPAKGRTIAGEAAVCTELVKDDPAKIAAQMERYNTPDLTVLAGYVLVRKHHDKGVVKLMESWWSEIERGSRRDQLSLPWVLHRSGFKPTVFPREEYGLYIRRHGHNW